MRRNGIHEPTIERVIELSGMEMLHPGGMALTQRTAEVAGLGPGVRVLDVSSGRGTQAIFYAQRFGADVNGMRRVREELCGGGDLGHSGRGLRDALDGRARLPAITGYEEGLRVRPLVKVDALLALGAAPVAGFTTPSSAPTFSARRSDRRGRGGP